MRTNNYRFTAEYQSHEILKTGRHLETLRARVGLYGGIFLFHSIANGPSFLRHRVGVLCGARSNSTASGAVSRITAQLSRTVATRRRYYDHRRGEVRRTNRRGPVACETTPARWQAGEVLNGRTVPVLIQVLLLNCTASPARRPFRVDPQSIGECQLPIPSITLPDG